MRRRRNSSLIAILYRNDRSLRRAVGLAGLWTLWWVATALIAYGSIQPQMAAGRWALAALVVAFSMWGIVVVELLFALLRHRYIESHTADELINQATAEYYSSDIEIPDEATKPQE